MYDIDLNDVDFAPSYVPEVSPSSWMLPNRIGFGSWIQKTFHYKGKKKLFMHQRFVKDFMQWDSPYRGLMLYHGLGVGKSATSIAAAEVLKKYLKVVIVLPASLKQNYIGEIQKYGSIMFAKQQQWRKHDLTEVGNMEDVLKAVRLSAAVAKKNKGVWLPVKSAGSSKTYADMSTDEQSELDRQLHDIITKHYTFVSYDGIKMVDFPKMTEHGNPFDNSVVIIDEVHHFISMSIGGKIGKKLYEMMMDAKNTKLILLSGTPIINYPYEISYLLNLASGYIYTYHLKYSKTNAPPNEAILAEVLKSHAFVDTYTVRTDANTIILSLLPEGFIFVDKEAAHIQRLPVNANADAPTHVATLTQIMQTLSQRAGLTFLRRSTQWTPQKDMLLPRDNDEFNAYFVDLDKQRIKNAFLLARRIQGLVSYYEVYSPELYPTQHPAQVVKLPLSAGQFTRYVEVRYEERKREDQARKNRMQAAANNNKDVFQNNTGVYRMTSRALCNFVFPTDIKRPYGAQNHDTHLESIDGDADAQIKEALSQLSRARGTYLHVSKLQDYSPKMHAILKHINKCAGTSLIYSQFRNVEGLGVMAMCLDANGYVELRLKKAQGAWAFDVRPEDREKPKYIRFMSNKEETKILMDIFNSSFENVPRSLLDQMHAFMPQGARRSGSAPAAPYTNLRGELVKVMMITQSGSEGISLKNVRQVHIMEPYWNNIRIDQVIGRAVRANSHVALPPQERQVHVYVYVSTLTPEQLAKDQKLRSNDSGITSDEYLYDIAMRKTRIVSGILSVLKEAAVDCSLHEGHHEGVRCKRMPVNRLPHSVAYQSDIQMDETDEQFFKHVQQKKTTVAFMEVVYKGVKYAYDKESMAIYDFELAKSGVLRQVGKVKKSEKTGRMKIALNESNTSS